MYYYLSINQLNEIAYLRYSIHIKDILFPNKKFRVLIIRDVVAKILFIIHYHRFLR